MRTHFARVSEELRENFDEIYEVSVPDFRKHGGGFRPLVGRRGSRIFSMGDYAFSKDGVDIGTGDINCLTVYFDDMYIRSEYLENIFS